MPSAVQESEALRERTSYGLKGAHRHQSSLQRSGCTDPARSNGLVRCAQWRAGLLPPQNEPRSIPRGMKGLYSRDGNRSNAFGQRVRAQERRAIASGGEGCLVPWIERELPSGRPPPRVLELLDGTRAGGWRRFGLHSFRAASASPDAEHQKAKHCIPYVHYLWMPFLAIPSPRDLYRGDHQPRPPRPHRRFERKENNRPLGPLVSKVESNGPEPDGVGPLGSGL